MKIYYPYPSDKPEKKYYIITKSEKKYILALLECLILQYIKMKIVKIDIFSAMKKMNLNFGINQELTPLHFGL